MVPTTMLRRETSIGAFAGTSFFFGFGVLFVVCGELPSGPRRPEHAGAPAARLRAGVLVRTPSDVASAWLLMGAAGDALVARPSWSVFLSQSAE